MELSSALWPGPSQHFLLPMWPLLYVLSMNLPRELFIWKYEHDVCLIREILLVEPYVHKPQSKERGQAWSTITANPNALEQPAFRVAIRAVRDRLFKLLEK